MLMGRVRRSSNAAGHASDRLAPPHQGTSHPAGQRPPGEAEGIEGQLGEAEDGAPRQAFAVGRSREWPQAPGPNVPKGPMPAPRLTAATAVLLLTADRGA